MSETHQKHSSAHDHKHGPNCGHVAVKHNGHIDYLHDGHLHHPHGDHVEDHRIEVTSANPEKCTPNHNCAGHEKTHVHSANCGHPAIPHGNHVDYLVEGHLHHSHGTHCDDHGKLETAVGSSSGGAA